MQGAVQRPMGITILAVLALIGGAFGILGSLALIGLGLGSIWGILGIVLLLLSVGELAFGYGAWTLQPWAWMLGIAIEGALIVINLLYIVSGVSSIFSVIINIIVAAAILYYLMTPEVKKAFGQP